MTNLTTFLSERRADWQRLDVLLSQVEGSGLGTLDDEQAVEFARLYRRAASDLNQAQTFVSGDATVSYLNDLVARCYLVIYAKSRVDVRGFLRALLWDYPLVFRRYYRQVLVATAILLVGAVFGFVASYFDVEVARGYLMPTEMQTIKPGDEGHLGDTGNLAAFSGMLFRNNVSVSLVAFALGLTLGLGTVWILFQNGVILGVLAAVFFEAGEFEAFCTGILPHGVLEIPAILIGGAAGLLLAQGILRARPWPRLEELARVGKEALWLVAGCIPLLGVAAVLEAFVARAPSWYLDSGLKLAVAGLFGLLFLAYVLLARRGSELHR